VTLAEAVVDRDIVMAEAWISQTDPTKLALAVEASVIVAAALTLKMFPAIRLQLTTPQGAVADGVLVRATVEVPVPVSTSMVT
jgi:hypothetical protein